MEFKIVRKILIASIGACLIIYSSLCFAEDIEGIFIEAVSEVNWGRLTLDEIRTRPTAVAASDKKTFIEADGYYIAGDGPEESQYVAQDRARADAKRMASEEAIIHIRSISEVKRGKLTRDEVHTISMTVLQITDETVNVEVIGGAMRYHCHIKAFLTDASVSMQLNPADREKFNESVRRAIEIERESARLNAELAALKEKYKTASNTERQRINAEVRRNEEQFNATMWNEKGLELYNQNDYDGATECFRKAVEIAPNYVSAWNGLGYIANYQGNFDKAIEYCYKAIELNSTYAAAWNNLGYAYTYKGTFDRAIECYKRAIELEPKDAAAQINLGNVYDALKNIDTAITYYQKALEISPDYANAWNSLGYAYNQKGDFDKGIEYCRKAVELDSHYAAAWNGLGYAYNQKKKYYKAIECCRKAVGLKKNYANAWNNLGYACSKVNRHEDSWTAYRNAVKISPNVQLYRDNLEIAQKRVLSFKSL